MNIMQQVFPDRVFDVGIAEGHAVTFSAGLAKEGMVPFCNIYSSFLQRAYDNIIHDVALQRLHVVFCIDRAGIVGADGATHHGLLDLAFLRPIPNMTVCAPMTACDLKRMMRFAEQTDGPIAIRYPRGRCVVGSENDDIHRAVQLKQGSKAAVLSIGAIGNTVAQAVEDLDVAHYDMRWLKPLDTAVLDQVADSFSLVLTVEDGMIAGGLGSAVLEYFADKGYSCRVLRLGVNDRFVEHGSTAELYRMLGLDKEGIHDFIQKSIGL